MKSFILTPEAQADVFAISDHLSAQSADAALVVLAKLEVAIGLLAENANIGRARPDLSPRRVLRCGTVLDYLIFYHPANPIEVVRIIHGAQDLPEVFGVQKKTRKKRP